MPSLEHLQECFTYNKDTGELFWKVRPLHHFASEHIMKIWNNKHSGKIISCIDDKGYYKVKIDGINYFAPRIIWKLETGNDPKNFIDHIDENTSNNIISNLRDIPNNEYRIW